jgi:hypothetical protein
MAFDKHMYSCFCFTYAYASACGDHHLKYILMIIEFKPRQSRTPVVGITSDDQTNFNLVSGSKHVYSLVG